MAVKANASVTIADVSDGIDGTGIKSTTIEYQAGSSGTSAPTGTWYESPPSTTATEPYMWTRVTYVYTDGSDPKIVYSVGATPEGIRGELNDLDEELHQTIVDQKTSIMSDAEQIVLSAIEEKCVSNDEYGAFMDTVNAQLSIMADEIEMKFSNVTENVGDVNTDLQTKITELYKYISFSGENGIVIGDGTNQLSLTIDTDGIHFSKNGEDFGFWDGNDFYTGNIMVRTTERAQFGNYAFVPRSDGSLMFLKVGG